MLLIHVQCIVSNAITSLWRKRELKNHYDITIIGGGPVGLFAATYARMHLAQTQVIESLDQSGGQVSALFPAKEIYDIPGFTRLTGQELIDNLTRQAQHYGPEIKLNQTVQEIITTDQGYEVVTNQGSSFTKTIIVATGAGSFQPRKLRLPEAGPLEGTKVFYFVKDQTPFIDQDIAIAGGGDSAVDWALHLAEVAHSVTLIHRRDQFRALESSVAKLEPAGVKLATPYTIRALADHNEKLKLTLKKARSTTSEELVVDKLLVNYGFVSNNNMVRSWGLDTDKRGITVDRTMMTSRPNIFAIGDAASYPGKTPLIATGWGEAPIAINAALNAIYPDRNQALHSTQLIKNFVKD